VHLTGPLDAIQWKIQWSAIALPAAQGQWKSLLEGVLRPPDPGASGPAPSSPLDKLRERLRKSLSR